MLIGDMADWHASHCLTDWIGASREDHVSARLNLTQLGWIVYDDRIHESNATGVPILLEAAGRKRKAPPPADPVLAELEAIELSLGETRHRRQGSRKSAPRSRGKAFDNTLETEDLLASQLRVLGTMYSGRRQATVRDNFEYLAFRALDLMGTHMRPDEFGQAALASPRALESWFLNWQRGYGAMPEG